MTKLSSTRHGSEIAGYRLIRRLGAGAFGEVWEAVHEVTEMHKALKLLRSEFRDRLDLRQRFQNEARALAHVAAPGVVRFDEVGELADGTPYILMELVQGQTLFERLQRCGRVTEREAMRYTWELALTMHAAHAAKIVHRDLKPANVMICPDPVAPGGERIKVLDFGIAKLLYDDQDSAQLTQEPIGTWAYMSPEQFANQAITFRSDVYSLGIMLYEMLAGRCPFVGNPASIALQHVSQRPPPLEEITDGSVEPELEALLFEMMEKAPAARPDMQGVAARLNRLLQTRNKPAETWVPEQVRPAAPRAARAIPVHAGQPAASDGLSARPPSKLPRTGIWIAVGGAALVLVAPIGLYLARPAEELQPTQGAVVSEPVQPAPPVARVETSPPPDLAPPLDASPPFVSRCSEEGWCTIAPVPGVKRLSRIWGPSAREIWAVGETSTLVWFDGSSWSTALLPLSGATHLRGLFGSAANDVWAAGDRGTVIRFDGSTWSVVPTGVSTSLNALWGTGEGEVWGVGRDGAILHRDRNGSFAPATSGTGRSLYSIWSSGPHDVWAVGSGGVILHYDGASWSAVESGTRQPLSAIWGRNSADIFAAGRKGTILHYDGQVWSAQDSGTDAELKSVWGFAQFRDVWAAGAGGTILRWDGEHWQRSESGLTAGISEIWGAHPADLWAIGDGGILLRNQRQPARPLPPAPPTAPPAADRGPAGADLPEQLTWQITPVLTRLGPQIQRCGQAGSYYIRFTVEPTGHVSAATAPGIDTDGAGAKDRAAETASCILSTLRKSRFPAFSGHPQSMVYPFIVR